MSEELHDPRRAQSAPPGDVVTRDLGPGDEGLDPLDQPLRRAPGGPVSC